MDIVQINFTQKLFVILVSTCIVKCTHLGTWYKALAGLIGPFVWKKNTELLCSKMSLILIPICNTHVLHSKRHSLDFYTQYDCFSIHYNLLDTKFIFGFFFTPFGKSESSQEMFLMFSSFHFVRTVDLVCMRCDSPVLWTWSRASVVVGRQDDWAVVAARDSKRGDEDVHQSNKVQ